MSAFDGGFIIGVLSVIALLSVFALCMTDVHQKCMDKFDVSKCETIYVPAREKDLIKKYGGNHD